MGNQQILIVGVIVVFILLLGTNVQYICLTNEVGQIGQYTYGLGHVWFFLDNTI